MDYLKTNSVVLKYSKACFDIMDNTKPIFIKPRRVPYSFQEGVNREIERLVSEDVLVRVESSDWGTPIVPILKKDGSIRVCVDYKSTINPFLKDVKCFLPNIDDIFAALSGGTHFTTLDLKNAYNQIEVDEASQQVLAWSTQQGVFACKRMSFGAKTAPAIFQSIITKTLQGCPHTVCFFDDICVTGSSIETHIKNLDLVFQKLSAAGFTLNLHKCKFLQEKVKFLGYVIDREGLHKDESKIAAVVNAPKPTNPTEVKAFVGLVNYYSRFFPNLAQVLFPIYQLLKSTEKFEWTEDCSKSFKLVKEIIASEKVLVHFDQKLPIKLVCDASQRGIGAAIFHTMPSSEERPIAFVSKTLSKAQTNYSTIDREALAIFFGESKFAHYLIGRKFTLQTDHKPLIAIFGDKRGIPTMAASRLQRWALFLSSFDFKIEYIVGKNNVNADFLSRLPTSGNFIDEEESNTASYVNFIENASAINFSAVRAATAEDQCLSQVINFVKNGWPTQISVEDQLKPFKTRANELNIEHDLLLWGYRVIIPSALRKKFLGELHSTHSGIVKMKAKARSHFWWPKLDEQIEKVAGSCHQCLQLRQNPPPTKPLPWPKPSAAFERVHIDFLGPMAGKMFLIVLDSYSKWVEAYAMKTITTKDTIECLRDCIARFGLPSIIVSDNGRQFASAEFSVFCAKNNIKHLTSAPYLPKSNGAAEKAVKSFKAGITKALSDKKNEGESTQTIINRYLFYYRSSVHSTTLETPFKLMFGREMKTQFDRIKPSSVAALCDKSSRREESIPKFTIGERVFVRDYRSKHEKWQPATIKATSGNRLYICATPMGEWRRHADQIIRRKSGTSLEILNDYTSPTQDVDRVLPETPNEHLGPQTNMPPPRPAPLSRRHSSALPVHNSSDDDNVFFSDEDDRLGLVTKTFVRPNQQRISVRRTSRDHRQPDRLGVQPK